MNILIFGGTNFIGYSLTHILLERGHNVTLFNRGTKESNIPSGVFHIRGDKNDLHDYTEQFLKVKPDVIIDMILLGDEDSTKLMNVARRVTSRVIAISSCDVYRAFGRLLESEPGIPDETPLKETSPLREKLYPYKDKTESERMKVYDKILVERNVMNDDIVKGTVLRLPMVYGPRDYQFRFRQYLKRMDDGREFILLDNVTAKWKTNRGYVDDVAYGIALAAENENSAGEIFNIAEIDPLTEKEFVEKIAKYHGWNGKIIEYKNEDEVKFPRQDLITDSSKIRELIGYVEVTPEETAYKKTIEWERANIPDDFKIDYTSEDELLEKIKS